MMCPPRSSGLARSLALLAAGMLLAAAPAPALAQTAAGPADTTLDGRMRAFLEHAREGDEPGLAAFFPRRGDWDWVQTMKGPRGVRRAVTWRIPGAETLRAIGDGGPACESFETAGGDVGPTEDSFARLAGDEGWRRTGRARFVPPGAPARSPVFVQWRREGGAWVVDAFGDVQPYTPALLGRPVEMISRDTGPVPGVPAYAAGTDWYRDSEPLVLDGLRYVKYGPPRPFFEADMVHLARIGARGRVGIYMETAMNDVPVPGVLFVSVAPGEFQPYMGFGRVPCR